MTAAFTWQGFAPGSYPDTTPAHFSWTNAARGAASSPLGSARAVALVISPRRTLRTQVAAPWHIANASASRTQGRMEAATPGDARRRAPWGIAVPQASRHAVPWVVAGAADRAAIAPWGEYDCLQATAMSPWAIATPADRAAQAPWGRYDGRSIVPGGLVWVASKRSDQIGIAPWGIYGTAQRAHRAVVIATLPIGPWWLIPWVRYSRPLNPGWGVVVEPGNPPIDENGTLIVPIRSAYIVINEITLVRAADSAQLTATSINVQIDADSWTWGWDATIPGDELELVEPTAPDSPVELVATINGEQFRLLVERIARDRRFGQSRLRISGRSRAAMLASPYSPIVTRSNAGAMTMQQLADDALTTNGVPIGWAVDWQAASWLVPAGAWNNTGSYIEHAQRLAEAAGAYVQADPLLDTLHVLPRYPLLPWEWGAATPDIVLPSAPVVREAIEWVDKARYNRVFISGSTASGVLGQVTRTGTAGDVVAPMVTDALITHADAARARGRAVLADTGRQARITLDLPILAETGIIAPGKLVRYTDGGTERVGLVRSTAVRAQLPTARQTIELETHA